MNSGGTAALQNPQNKAGGLGGGSPSEFMRLAFYPSFCEHGGGTKLCGSTAGTASKGGRPPREAELDDLQRRPRHERPPYATEFGSN